MNDEGDSNTGLKVSPLNAEHVALGAKLVPFGGWNMPLSYPDGTLAEHRVCRTGGVIFDVSHLGTVRVEGAGAFSRLQSVLTNDLRKIAPGRAQYTHLLDGDASVLDDIIIWWIAEDVFDVMPNASNTSRVLNLIGGTDVTETRAVIAAQGPKARDLCALVSPEAAAVERFCVAQLEWDGTPVVVAGTGYTGEDGIEISVPAPQASKLWTALHDAGLNPAGLGARDTLRLEAGLPLHGHELGEGITPLQAGLGWVIAWDKPEGFHGKQALLAEKESGPQRILRGIRTADRRPPRDGAQVFRGDDLVGVVSSGNFSPTLETGIAMAFCDPGVKLDDQLEIDVRGKRIPGTVIKLPFVKRS